MTDQRSKQHPVATFDVVTVGAKPGQDNLHMVRHKSKTCLASG
jgi:hypothetical protein